MKELVAKVDSATALTEQLRSEKQAQERKVSKLQSRLDENEKVGILAYFIAMKGADSFTAVTPRLPSSEISFEKPLSRRSLRRIPAVADLRQPTSDIPITMIHASRYDPHYYNDIGRAFYRRRRLHRMPP